MTLRHFIFWLIAFCNRLLFGICADAQEIVPLGGVRMGRELAHIRAAVKTIVELVLRESVNLAQSFFAR